MLIGDFGRELDRVSENIKGSDELLDRNKDSILDYKQDQVLNGLSEATLLPNTQRLKKVAERAEKPFDETDKRDVKGLVTRVHEQDYTDKRWTPTRRSSRRFGRLEDTERDETPAEVKWIQLSNSRQR